MIMRNFKTAKGTELPLLNLGGKEYLEVKFRLVWFREEHPNWSIETEFLSVTKASAYARATVRDDKGRVIATSHKFETCDGFPDFIEKAETGAIGRALALIGYGTQFCADELDEGKRIVDAPVKLSDDEAPAASGNAEPVEPGEYQITFGRRYKGRKLKDIPQNEIKGYLTWLESNALREGSNLSYQVRFLKDAYERLYGETEETATAH